jgi:hypothetical protein
MKSQLHRSHYLQTNKYSVRVQIYLILTKQENLICNSCLKVSENTAMEKVFSEISGSHGGEYEDGCLLGCCAV